MSGRRAVFLDRDGTLLELVAYLHRPEEVSLIAGAASALRRLGQKGWLRVVVTNQSGIARGTFSMKDVLAVHERMLELLHAEGADLDGIEICPHHPDYTGPCSCRKPAPGMISRAADRLGIDTAVSWVIGDRSEDLQAGHLLGARTILVRTGYGREEEVTARSVQTPWITRVADDLSAACELLLAETARAGSQEGAGDSPVGPDMAGGSTGA